MCDYSAEGVERRDAREGEDLTLAHITDHTRGFKSPDDLDVAVCLKPGQRLRLTVTHTTKSGWFWNRRHHTEVEELNALFVQPTVPLGHHRDSLWFLEPSAILCLKAGEIKRLQALPIGTRARVLKSKPITLRNQGEPALSTQNYIEPAAA
jgi:hypothetical protein